MTQKYLGSNLDNLKKGKLTDLLVIDHPLWGQMVNDGVLPEFFTAIGTVHENAAKKHPPYSWEKEISYETDCLPVCNLDAMLRHMLRISLQGEEIDAESGLAHAWHLACRWQMFVTTLLRQKEITKSHAKEKINTKDEYKSVEINPTFGDLSNEGILKDLNPWVRYIAPESVYVLMTLDPEFLKSVLDDYWYLGERINSSHNRAIFSAILTCRISVKEDEHFSNYLAMTRNTIHEFTAHVLAYFASYLYTNLTPKKK